MRSHAPLAAFVASLATVGVLAQTPPTTSQTPPADPPQQQTFRAGANTVVVPTTVTDAGGRFIRDLEQDDFEIRDNGQRQEIAIFSREYQTVSVVVIIDASASMIPLLDRVISAANDFIVRLMPGDVARIGSFAEEIRISPDFTGDRDELLAVFSNEFNVRIGRRTRLWDAMYEAVETLIPADGRRVVIVVTDGVDSWSSRRYDDVESLVQRHDIGVFTVRVNHRNRRRSQTLEFMPGPDGSSPGRRSLEPRGAFERLARETGGGFIDVDADWAHQAPFTDIMLDLHSAYLLGFTPQTFDGELHQLTVEVRRRDVNVKFRRSYVAEAR